MIQIIIEQNDQGQVQLRTNGPIPNVTMLGLLEVGKSLITSQMNTKVEHQPSIVPASASMLDSLKNRINGG